MNGERHFIKCLKCKRFTSMSICILSQLFLPPFCFCFVYFFFNVCTLDSYVEIKRKRKSHFISDRKQRILRCKRMRENQFGICSHVEINLNIHIHSLFFAPGHRQHPDGEAEQSEKKWANKFMHINSIAVLDKSEFCLRAVVRGARMWVSLLGFSTHTQCALYST